MILLDFSQSMASNISKLSKLEDYWAKDLIKFLQEWNNEREFVLLKTSGSTGIPKTVKAKKNWLTFSASNTLQYFKLKPGNTAILALSVNFIAGKMMTIRAIVGHLQLWVVPPNDLSLLKENIKIDFCPLVPIQVEKNAENLHKIKHVLIGGGSISSSLEKKLKDIKTNFYHSFAMTETFSHFAIRDMKKVSNDFEVFKHIEIGTDENNCLWIKAPQLGITFIQTTDIISLTAQGFVWKGRMDFIINSGGLKLNPENLEAQCTFLNKEKIQFIISSIPDEKLENKLVILIKKDSLPKGFPLLKKEDFPLKKYEIPKQVYLVNGFPTTKHSNKIKRLNKAELFDKRNIISIHDIK